VKIFVDENIPNVTVVQLWSLRRQRLKMLGRVYALSAISVLLIVSGCSAARPLHRSEASICVSLLKRTPLGTSKKDVEAFIAKEGWHPSPNEWASTKNRIEVCFGGYAIFFGTCYVYGAWDFDKDDHLIEVRVSKSRDVL
jgi:hypothetical protein